MARARAGLVVLHPVPKYLEATPTKLFEYMSAGIPVIASDFPAWRSIVEGHDCGLSVDPCDPAAIADAIRLLIDDEAGARRMGENGRRAVLEHYGWTAERDKLLALYDALAAAA
jgi:glycosyltransferase involved in cell wall biosynthesis